MTAYVALLRGVNVLGFGKLPMAHLVELCGKAGFAAARTYIASGNAVFRSDGAEADVRSRLQAALATYSAKPIGLVVRSAAEMAAVAAPDPFPDEARDRVMALFTDLPLPPTPPAGARNLKDEQVRLGRRELVIFYPAGQGRSRLQAPGMKTGTARNMNTVARLAAMAAEIA